VPGEWLIYLGRILKRAGVTEVGSVMRARAMSDGTEVACVLWGATKSAGTLSIEI